MPSLQFSIRVLKKDGKPAKNKSVSVHYSMTRSSGTTDGSGWVTFVKATALSDSISANVYIDGHNKGSISVKNGATYSFML